MMSALRGKMRYPRVRERGCVEIGRRGVVLVSRCCDSRSTIESNLPRIMVLRVEDARQRYGCRGNGGDCHDEAGSHLK